MKWFRSLFERQLVGLDLGVSGIKAAEIQSQKTPRLLAYNRVPLPWGTISPEGEIADRGTVVVALKKLFSSGGFTTKNVAIGLSGNSIMTKKITIAQMKPAELREQLYWEAEQYIPFNVNDVNLDFAVLGASRTQGDNGTPMMDVLLVAAKKDYVHELSQLVQEAGLVPSVLDNQVFALGNAFEFNYGHIVDSNPGGATSVIVDFGAGSTKISVVEGDKTVFTRELRQSGSGCTQLVAERLGIGFGEAEKMKIDEAESDAVAPIIAEYVASLTDEVARTLDYSITQSGDNSIQGVYVCGGGSKTSGLFESLEKRLPSPVQPLNAVQNIAGSGRKMSVQAIRELGYLGAVAIGLSLRTTGDAA